MTSEPLRAPRLPRLRCESMYGTSIVKGLLCIERFLLFEVRSAASGQIATVGFVGS